MNLNITNISFKGQTPNNNTRNSLEERIRRFNSRGNMVAVPVDEGNPLTAPRYGIAYPTPFEDCFEKMSFEEEADNMWRDAQYTDEYVPPRGYPQHPLASHIITESPNITIDYSIDDVPVSTSNYRRRVGLNDLADINATLDTDISSQGKRTLNKINYFDNIVPHALKYTSNLDFVVFDDYSGWASIYEEDGYPRASIIRAMEKSCLKDRKGNKHAEIELFKILIEYPNIRPLVVTKCGNDEIFDTTTANYYRTLHRHYFDDEKEIKKALNLCKVDDNGTLRSSQELCEIVTLLRRKTAQNIEVQDIEYENIDNESTYQRNKKYVDKATPLTENDIELLRKLKVNNQLDNNMYTLVKFLLKENNLAVSYILENYDKFALLKREDINRIITKLKNIPYSKSDSIDEVKRILEHEIKNSKTSPVSQNNVNQVATKRKKDRSLENLDDSKISVNDSNEKLSVTKFETVKPEPKPKKIVQQVETPEVKKVEISNTTPTINPSENDMKQLGNEHLRNKTLKVNTEVKKNLTEEEIKTEIDKIFKRLLGSDRILTFPDNETFALLKAADKKAQPELISLINEMLDKWCTSSEIVRAVRAKVPYLRR